MRTWLVVLALAVVAGLLVVFDVIALPGLGDGESFDPAPEELLASDDLELAGDPTLSGLAGAEGPSPSLLEADAEGEHDGLRAEMAGSTPGGGVVRGRVLRQEGRMPVPGALVSLGRPDSIFRYLRASVNGRFDTLQARTDDEGRFAFVDVTPSDGYVVRASNTRRTLVSAKDIDLRGGVHLDLGDLLVWEAGGLAGAVIDAQEKGVANARVVVTWRVQNALQTILTDPDELPEVERETRTDADGSFEVEGLEPGEKSVIVVAPTGASDAIPNVEVDRGSTTEMDPIVLSGTHRIHGTVRWAGGEPIEGVRVVAAPMMHPIARQALSDADGAFSIDHLPQRDGYAVGTMVPGLPVQLTLNVPLDGPAVEIVVPRPAPLAGQVVDALSGAPVPRFTVELVAKATGDFVRDMVAGQVQRAVGAAAFRGPEGRFAFPKVAVGTYALRIVAPGYPVHRVDPFEVNAAGDSAMRVELVPGRPTAGRVVDPEGQPSAQAHVYVVPAGSTSERRVLQPGSAGVGTPAAYSDSDGRFELPPQSPGVYDVLAFAKGQLPARQVNVRFPRPEGDVLRLEAPPSAPVEVRVLEADGTTPAPREQVVVFFASGDVTGETSDQHGLARFDHLPTGRCKLIWSSHVPAGFWHRFGQRHADGGSGEVDREEQRRAYESLEVPGGELVLRQGETARLTLHLPRRTRVLLRIRKGEAVPEGLRFCWCVRDAGQADQRGVSLRVVDGLVDARIEPGVYQLYLPTAGQGGRWVPIPLTVPDVPQHERDVQVPAPPPTDDR